MSDRIYQLPRLVITAWLWHPCRISGKDNTAKYPWYYSTVLVDGHLYDTGRMTTSCTKEAIERVVAYDLIKNEMMSCPSLCNLALKYAHRQGWVVMDMTWFFELLLVVCLNGHAFYRFDKWIPQLLFLDWPFLLSKQQTYMDWIFGILAKFLAKMTQLSWYHSTVLVEGHFYDTGRITSCTEEAIERVVAYDFIKNEMRSCPSLPVALKM